jgi:hypothetical protein
VRLCSVFGMKRACLLNAGYLAGHPPVSCSGMKSLNDPVVRAKSSRSSQAEQRRLVRLSD